VILRSFYDKSKGSQRRFFNIKLTQTLDIFGHLVLVKETAFPGIKLALYNGSNGGLILLAMTEAELSSET
jgi:c-di-GMP-binding flagellar brake protein YcgR